MRRSAIEARFIIDGKAWSVGISDPIDISIELDPRSHEQPAAFFLPRAFATTVEIGNFIGDTRRGGSCNCEAVTLYPHGNGTHTESVGHISHERVSVHGVVRGAFFPATLLTVHPEPIGPSGESYPYPHNPAELAVSRAAIQRALAAAGTCAPGFLDALVIRTEPNGATKRHRSYSGASPVYMTREAMELIADEMKVLHLLVDLPSVDREEDGGILPNHRTFWGMPHLDNNRESHESAKWRSITEMVYVDSHIADGVYLLNLQVPPLVTDAVPSRPLLFAVTPFHGAF